MWGAMLALALITVAAVLMGGCTKTVYLPAESTALRADTVRQIIRHAATDTIREKEYVHDTRYDSVAPILDSLNRVIGWDRYHFRETTRMSDRERSRLLARIDSLKQSRTDSVYIERPYPVEKIVEVERKRGWWETLLLYAAGMMLIAVSVIAAWSFRDKKRN